MNKALLRADAVRSDSRLKWAVLQCTFFVQHAFMATILANG